MPALQYPNLRFGGGVMNAMSLQPCHLPPQFHGHAMMRPAMPALQLKCTAILH
jgi:hypothetical protein